MRYTFNPFTGNFDAWENNFGTTGIFLVDENGVKWQLTVDTAGVLITTLAPVTSPGDTIGTEDGFAILLETGDKVLVEA